MADGDILLLAGLHHGLDPVVVADVAGVDADLVHPLADAFQGQAIVKVDIGHNGDIHRLGHRGNKAEDLSRHGAHIHAGSQRRGKTHLHGIGAHPLHLAGQVGQLAGGVAPYARDELAVAAPQ